MVSDTRVAAPALGAQEWDDARAAEAGQLLHARPWWDNPGIISGSTTLRAIPQLPWDLLAKPWVQLGPTNTHAGPTGRAAWEQECFVLPPTLL